MNPELIQLFHYYTICVVLMTIAGLYCILASYNLVRVLIGIELLVKASTVSIIFAGHLTGNTGLAQAIVITLIVIEVVLMVVAGGLILWIFRHNRTIDTQLLRRLKG